MKWELITEMSKDLIDSEDGGEALIFHASPDDEDTGMFVKIQSWDESTAHVDFNKFVDKKVRITIETID